MKDQRQPRILIADELAPVAMEVFRRRGLEPEVRTGLSPDALIEAAREVDAIVVRSASKITRQVIENATHLRVIGRAGIGVDNIDIHAATEHGVVVMNTPHGNATTTAELAVALMLGLARHLPQADRMVRSGVWKKKRLMGTEVAGKTLGVIGLGRIGRLVAERGRGLGMKVCGHDPYLEVEGVGTAVPGVELLELDTLLERADFVSLHVPLTDSTRNLISWKRLANIKEGARLIHVSRGGVVDEEAVLDALNSGRLAGAAFDVFCEEPPPKDHPLLQRDDVLLTPHLGASSEEAQLRVASDIAEEISTFLLEGVAENALNAPSLPADALQELAPFLLLAEKLGSFLAQKIDGPMRKVEFEVAGEVTRFGVDHLRLAFLVGCLRHSLDTPVNFVNAPTLARERGILILENSQEEANYRQGEIRVRASERTGGKIHSIRGAVFGRDPRITAIENVHLDLPLRGPLLATRHRDLPGVLGAIGQVLGRHQVNIRRLELGPSREGSEELAYGFLTLYSDPPQEAVAEVAQLEAIEQVQLIRL